MRNKGGKVYQGGIFCVIPIGMLYDERIAESVRWRLKKYLGVTAKELEKSNLNTLIKNTIEGAIRDEMRNQKYADYMSLKERVTVSSSDPFMRRFRKERVLDMIEEVTNSYGYAIYHNGKRVLFDAAPFSGQDGGAERLKDFFDLNKNKLPGVGSSNQGNINNWQIVIAVAAQIAARLEAHGAYPDNMYKGFGKRVLLIWAQIIANVIREKFGRVNMPVRYGYILSRQGYEGQVFYSNDIAIV